MYRAQTYNSTVQAHNVPPVGRPQPHSAAHVLRRHCSVVTHGSRPDSLTERGFGASKWVADSNSVYDVEADARYRRHDSSALHAHQARAAFVQSVQHGAARTDLVAAALAIAAEDDAIGARASVSSCKRILAVVACIKTVPASHTARQAPLICSRHRSNFYSNDLELFDICLQ